jgi:inosine-uridine nucleoside N-ribohydrolase
LSIIKADPEAARIVFDTEIKKVMILLDPLWNGGHLTANQVCDIQNATGNPWCEMAGKIFSCTRELVAELGREPIFEVGCVTPPDLLAVAVGIDPSIAEIQDFHVFIETSGEYTRGMTVIDNRQYGRAKEIHGRGKVSVAMSVDQVRYSELVLSTWLAD